MTSWGGQWGLNIKIHEEKDFDSVLKKISLGGCLGTDVGEMSRDGAGV